MKLSDCCFKMEGAKAIAAEDRVAGQVFAGDCGESAGDAGVRVQVGGRHPDYDEHYYYYFKE